MWHLNSSLNSEEDKYLGMVSSPVRTLKRSRSLFLDEEEEETDVAVSTENSSKRRQLSTYTNSTHQREETDIFSEYVLSQGCESSQNLAKKVLDNGLEYYYEAGRSASVKSTSSIAKIDEILRIESTFFEFQKLRGLPSEWPVDGLTIGMMYNSN